MAKRNGSVKRYIVVTLRAFADEGFFVSECVELGTASQGDDLEDALNMALDATEVYLEGLAELGELDAVLLGKKVKIHTTPPRSVSLRGQVHPGDLIKPLVMSIAPSGVSVAARPSRLWFPASGRALPWNGSDSRARARQATATKCMPVYEIAV